MQTDRAIPCFNQELLLLYDLLLPPDQRCLFAGLVDLVALFEQSIELLSLLLHLALEFVDVHLQCRKLMSLLIDDLVFVIDDPILALNDVLLV